MIIAYLTEGGIMTRLLYEVSQAVSMTGPNSTVTEWININFSNIYVGDTAPEYQDTVWIDTGSGKTPVIPAPLDTQQQLVADVQNLKDITAKL